MCCAVYRNVEDMKGMCKAVSVVIPPPLRVGAQRHAVSAAAAAASSMVWLKRFHRAGLFAFRTLPVFNARAVFIAFSAALILASRLTSGAGKFKAKFSLASARFRRSAFLVSEIGWPIKPSYA